MLKAYKYRIYPNAQQKQALTQAFGCARFVYNNSLSYKKDLTLKDRKWKCKRCNLQHDRDINAANNILEIGQGLPEYKALNSKNKVEHQLISALDRKLLPLG